MFEDEDWDAGQDEDMPVTLRASSEGGAVSGLALEVVLDRWISAAENRITAGEQVRRDIGRLKGQTAYRRRLIEMMQEQRFLQEALDDSYSD